MSTQVTEMEQDAVAIVEPADWWTGPGRLREVLVLALPLVASNLTWTLNNFIDRVFLMRDSEAAVAAALPAGVSFFTLCCIPLGIASYVVTFVSQYYGANREDRVGAAVWQGLWIALGCLPLVFAAAPFAHALFELAGHKPNIAALETVYFQISCVASPALVGAAALAGFFTGRGNSKIVMLADVAAAATNIVLDYCWIFGNFGFPAWGIAGAAWATVIALWVKFFILFALFLRPSTSERFGVWQGMRWDRELMGRLLTFGGPNGVQMFIEVAAFNVFILLVGALGELELAASSLAFNLNNLAFMPAWGVSMAATTLVGQYLGRNRADLAERSTWTALGVTTVYMLVISGVYVLTPNLFMAAYWSGENSMNGDPQLQSTVTVLLYFVASYCLLDGVNVIFAGALKGAGDTHYIMYTNIVLGSSVVVLTWLGIRYFELGLYSAWTILTLWVCALGVIFMRRFLQGHWREMRVIEGEGARG